MAKLKAHGAELARATQEKDTPNDESTTWERVERTYMADGNLMEKRTVRFRPTATWDSPTGRLHTWGWKLKGKVKSTFTPEAWADHYRQQGWTVTPATLTAKMAA